MTTPLQLEGWPFRWPLDESPISRAIIHTLRESQSALAPRLPCPTFGRQPAPSGRGGLSTLCVTLLIRPRPIAHKSIVNHLEEGTVTRLATRPHRVRDSRS